MYFNESSVTEVSLKMSCTVLTLLLVLMRDAIPESG